MAAMPLPSLQKPFIIPLFIPHAGCPHRCVFCSQTSTTGRQEAAPSEKQLKDDIDRFIGYRRDERRYTEIAYYGGNFLGLEPDRILDLLNLVTPYIRRGDVDGIRFSTRPETIDARRMDLIAGFPVTTVEMGVQSMIDSVLSASRRGHDARDVEVAVDRLKRSPYAIGLQMMIGLPGDTPGRAVATAERIIALAPDFVRIYPTLVIKGSRLERWYQDGRYAPWDLETAVETACRVYSRFTRSYIPVIRMGLQPTEALNAGADVVAGPFHPAFGELVHSALWYRSMSRWGIEGHGRRDTVDIQVNPRLRSRVVGQGRCNIRRLKARLGLGEVRVADDPGLRPDEIRWNGRLCRLEMTGDSNTGRPERASSNSE
jgi:histone acetyltransferase (RNA polymerase elongator complex component)